MEENGLEMESNWDVLVSLFPSNWRSLAKETGAFTRRRKCFKDEESIMRALLLHLANGYSLRETVTRAKISNLTDISDVTLLKRLRCSENWFKEMSLSLLRERGINTMSQNKTVQMKLVDGTHVKEPGKTGSQWRIHYCMKLPELQCDYFKLTSTTGAGNGESLTCFPVNIGDCIIGDRGYSHSPGIAYLSRKGAYSLVRVNTLTLKLYSMACEKIRAMDMVVKLEKEFQIGEWDIKIHDETEGFIAGRLCAIRKSTAAAEKAIANIKKIAAKKQQAIRPATLEYAKYIIIFTTLPKDEFPANTVLEWYRLRWQIELVFKRLKSLTHIGHLPKYDDQSARAWLYGKLFIALLVEKLVCYANLISPWGLYIPGKDQKQLEGV